MLLLMLHMRRVHRLVDARVHRLVDAMVEAHCARRKCYYCNSNQWSKQWLKQTEFETKLLMLSNGWLCMIVSGLGFGVCYVRIVHNQ